MQRIRTILAGIALGTLTACGGSGGGTGTGVSQLPGVGLNSGNVQVATAVVTDSSSVASGSAGGASFLTGVVTGTGHGSFHFRDFALQQLDFVAAHLAGAAMISGATISQTVKCGNGVSDGSAGVQATIADSSGTYLTTGDHLQIQFNQCNENGELLDGTFTLNVDHVSINFLIGAPTAPYDLAISTTLGNFSADDGTVKVLASGDLAIATADDGAGNISLELSGSALHGSDGTDTAVLGSYDFMFTGMANGDYTLDAMATVGSGKLGGSVSFRTTTIFSGNNSVYNGNATAGELLVTSSVDGSSAIVTVLPDGTNVQIQLDETGAGTYTTQMTTWSALAAL